MAFKGASGSVYDLNLIATRADSKYTPFYSFGTTLTGLVNNTRVDIWPLAATYPTYVFPAAAARMWVVSDSASDTFAGTGLQQIMIHGLLADYSYKEELVNLNGTTAVQTVNSFIRCNAMHGTQVGSGGFSAGNVSLQNTALTPTAVYAYIPATTNKSQQAIFTVPAGKTAYLIGGYCSAGAPTGTHFTQFYFRTTSDDDGNPYPGVFQIQGQFGVLNGGSQITYDIPFQIPEKTDVKMSVISDAANAGVTAIVFMNGWFEI